MDVQLKRILAETKAGSDHILPFLGLHGEPEETLREYMGVIQDANIGAVCVESRPHPDFLGDGWWHDLDILLDEAQKRDMKVWILDDSHFPTGYANGALQEVDENMCRQSLVYRILAEAADGESVALSLADCQKIPEWQPNLMEQYTMDFSKLRRFTDDRFVGAVAVKIGGSGPEDLIDLTEQVRSGSFTFLAPKGQWRIYALNLTRNRGPHRNYINMMDKASCKVLLDTVYEAHWQRYGALFGKTIAGFFSDEPEIGNGHLYESGKRLPDSLAREQPLFSGFVRYEKEMDIASGSKPLLEITDAWEGVEVFVNGKSLGIQIIPPMRYCLTGACKPGKNTITIEVATNLERQMSTQPDSIRQYLGLGDKKPTCPSGISGSIKLWKKQEA